MNDTSEPPLSVLTPQQLLAEKISTALVAEGLVLEEKHTLLRTKLATGQMKEDDWRTEIARAIHTAMPAKEGDE